VGHRADGHNGAGIERSHQVVSDHLGVIIVRDGVTERGEIRNDRQQQQPDETPAIDSAWLYFTGPAGWT
jgi:hypothetical protein